MTPRRRVLVVGLCSGWVLASLVGLVLIVRGEPLGQAYVLRDPDGGLRVGLSPCAGEAVGRLTVTTGGRPVWDVVLRAGSSGAAIVPLGTAPPGYAAIVGFQPPAGDDELVIEVTGTSGVLSGVSVRVGELPPGTYEGDDTDGPAPMDRLDQRDPSDFGC